MNTDLSFRQGIRDTLPTVFGYLGIGLAFGIVAHAAGLSLLVVFLLSFVLYAGSAQFIAVSMLAATSPVLSVILAVFLVNSRMILMAMTIAPSFRADNLAKNVWLGTLLTDESFALGITKRQATGGKLSFAWFNASNVVAYLTWNVASLIGALLASLIPNPTELGVGFAMTAMFIGLLYLQIRADASMSKAFQLLLVVITLVVFYLGMIFIPTSVLVLVVTLVVCGLGVLLHA